MEKQIEFGKKLLQIPVAQIHGDGYFVGKPDRMHIYVSLR